MAENINIDAPITFNIPHIQVDQSAKEKYIQLEIPLYIIQSICRFPVKWLRYVAWAILHVHGNVLIQPPASVAEVLEDDATVSPGDVLYFVARDNITASATVDLDATEVDTDSQTSASYLSDCPPMIFNDELLERDCNCIFTGIKRFKTNMHIIPFARGNPRLQQIVRSRGGPQDLDDINDVRNAFTAYRSIHIEFDSSFVVILVTPNEILDHNDIPEATTALPNSDQRPSDEVQYTLQYLTQDEEMVETLRLRGAVNNKVATFLDPSSQPLPSSLLLHYRYGGAVLTRFGTKTSQDTWKASDVWDRPDTEAVPSHTHTGPRAIIKKRERARALALVSDRMTMDEAMDFMAGISFQQLRGRQNRAWQQRRLEIQTWINTSGQ